MQKLPKTIKKELAVIQCQHCGKLIPVDDAQCHHHIVAISEIIQDYRNNKLTLQEAKDFARDRENIMVVCKECHKKLDNC